ncbi:hypothetical protein [Nocardia sp. NPDC057455]|uniref:hypothetical protein n=1 Tax=Nocardia sp. NPDC057455 TaxID=3346138 RepID=UPI00366D4B33
MDAAAGATPGAELRVGPDGVWSRLITTVRASPDWLGAGPGFEAPPVSGCFGADVRSIVTVSASAPCAEAAADAPVPERAGSPPSFPAGAFALPGPPGPEGAVPLAPGAPEAAEPAVDGAFRLFDGPVGGCAGRWPAGVFDGGPAGPEGGVPGVLEAADPEAEGVFWLPCWIGGVVWLLDCAVGGCAGRWPAGAFALPGPAGPDGAVPLAPGVLEAAEPAADGAFRLLDGPVGGCAGRWPAGVFDCGPAGPEGGVPGVLEAADPETGGVFWLLDCAVGGCAGRWPAGAFALPGPAGPDGVVPLAPGAPEVAEPVAGGVFWLPDCVTGGCAGRWPGWDDAEAEGFGSPVPRGAGLGALPVGLDAGLVDEAFASAARP